MIRLSPKVGILLLASAVVAMLLTHRTTDGLPRNEAWVIFLLAIPGPAGMVALALSLPSLQKRPTLAVFLATPVAYFIGLVLFMIVAVNFGIVSP